MTRHQPNGRKHRCRKVNVRMNIKEIAERDYVIIDCQMLSLEQLALEWLAKHTAKPWPEGKRLEISVELELGQDGRIACTGIGADVV